MRRLRDSHTSLHKLTCDGRLDGWELACHCWGGAVAQDHDKRDGTFQGSDEKRKKKTNNQEPVGSHMDGVEE